jgi:hypothetical protein
MVDPFSKETAKNWRIENGSVIPVTKLKSY